jgi:cytochrome P450
MPGVNGSLRNILDHTLAGGSFFDVVTERFERYGPIYSERILGTRIVNIYDLEATMSVLRTDKMFQMRPGFEAMADVGDEINPDTGMGPVSNDYAKWYHDRSLLSPKLMRPKEVHEALPLLNDVASDFVKRIENLSMRDDKINVFAEELPYWTVEAIAVCLFNQRFGFYQHPPRSEAVEFMDSAKGITDNLGVLLRTSPLHNKYVRIPAYYSLKKYFLRNISTGVDIINKQLKLQREDCKAQTFFEYLSAKENITPKSMALYLTGLMAAGIETTSTTSFWLLYELARHPSVQEKLYEELVSVFGRDGEVTRTNIQRLSYIKAILKESGRINPAAGFIIARVFDKDLNVLGYNVPAGVNIFIHEHLLSVDERYYGKNAKEFVPERWLRDENGKKSDLNAFTSLPFGFGVRMCLGRRLAEALIYTLITKLVLNFHLEYVGEKAANKVVMGGALMKPDQPVFFKFIPRTNEAVNHL